MLVVIFLSPQLVLANSFFCQQSRTIPWNINLMGVESLLIEYLAQSLKQPQIFTVYQKLHEIQTFFILINRTCSPVVHGVLPGCDISPSYLISLDNSQTHKACLVAISNVLPTTVFQDIKIFLVQFQHILCPCKTAVAEALTHAHLYSNLYSDLICHIIYPLLIIFPGHPHK